MAPDPLGRRLSDSGPFWFVVSVLGSLGGVWLSGQDTDRYTDPPPGGFGARAASALP